MTAENAEAKSISSRRTFLGNVALVAAASAILQARTFLNSRGWIEAAQTSRLDEHRMTLASRADVTTLLRAWSAGDQDAKEKAARSARLYRRSDRNGDGVLIISDPIEILFVSGATKGNALAECHLLAS
jgi:hypothetical protein